jgi:hypothetical protein
MSNILEILLNSNLSKDDLKIVIDGFLAGESLKLVKISKVDSSLKTKDRVPHKADKRQYNPSYTKFSKMTEEGLVAQFKKYCKTKPDAFDREESHPSYCKREMIRRGIIGEDLT